MINRILTVYPQYQYKALPFSPEYQLVKFLFDIIIIMKQRNESKYPIDSMPSVYSLCRVCKVPPLVYTLPNKYLTGSRPVLHWPQATLDSLNKYLTGRSIWTVN